MAQALPALFAAQAITSVGGTYNDVQASRAQDRYQRSASGLNMRMANLQAEDATRRGDVEASRLKKDAQRLQGSQRAAYAGQGVDVGSGTAALIQDETGTLGEMDAVIARNNAWREALGYRVEASDIASRSRMQTAASRFERRSTILTGGMNAFNYGVQGAYARDGYKPRKVVK